ncbi:Transcription factor TFIIIB component B'' like protein [Argiope bruennichi]|uniref:Transcription factor TFIIIB component B'' like protein n=1 Tax=Argiope bruennichi TaxID=94029 RepID=A0A8T0EN36_ARGBR|nr:Transcription factor TFIIIB component B'' like protein [Argiope bruennichi]
MASVAMLSPPIKKESDVLTRTSLLPKRKPIVSNVTTRARFVKPRPNVSVNKALKESLPAPSENTKTDNVPSQPIEAESELLQRPVIPKKTATIPALSRARFQRARPNIGLLVNKPVKDSHLPEERYTSDDLKTQQISDSKVDVPDDSVIESISDKRCDSDCKSPRVSSLFNTEKAVDTAFSIPESQLSPQPIVDFDPVCGDHQEFSSVRTTVPQDKTLESDAEESSHPDVPIRESETEISSFPDTERSLISPRPHFEIAQEKESLTASAIVNKNTEYPTLKSILNSPRKRTATKKVHERRKRVANFSSTPSRSEMTMVDLIYWNPSSSPMKEIKPTAPAVEDLLPVDDPPPKTDEVENCNIGPKVIINDDGEIILDESSLFVRRKDTVDHSVAAVVENDNTTYSSFRNRSFKTWSKRETAKFYKALSLVGTDFALMENIFKEDGNVTRTRRELKLKFKREEKSNPKFVHTAMYELQTYDLNILDEDHDIELLDESELIDDAPKQAKKFSISGIKTPGKRGRKKKSELTEAIVNENTSESILEVEEESREAIDSMSNGDLQVNKNDSESNSKLIASRPERIRKAKDLADYVTDVDDLSDTNDSEGETLPIKKRKTAQILSEEDDGSMETSENNGLVTGDHNTFQEKVTSNEEICPFITKEVDGSLDESNDGKYSGEIHIKKKRTHQTLPENNEESLETNNPFSDLMPETSRSGRKIKAKKMLDFIIDPDALSDSDAENPDSLGAVSQLCESTQLEEEFSIIPSAEANGEYSEEQNIICTLDVETPNENNLVIETLHEMDQNESNNPEIISVVETISPTEALSPAISSDQSKIDNFLKPDSENCNDVEANNILTDPVVTEVVVTSDQVPRRTRRKILPNVIKGSMRPPIQKKPVLPPRRTSFTSFTPVEEEMPKLNVVIPVKTYSKPTDSKLIKSEEQDDIPEYLETVQKSPANILRKRSKSGPSKSPCTPEISISRTNSMCTPTRSPLTNAPLNVFSFNSDSKSNMQHSSIEMPLNSSTADPKTINMNPENVSDSAPVVLFTRTPNNSNMLHLFLYQKS